MFIKIATRIILTLGLMASTAQAKRPRTLSEKAMLNRTFNAKIVKTNELSKRATKNTDSEGILETLGSNKLEGRELSRTKGLSSLELKRESKAIAILESIPGDLPSHIIQVLRKNHSLSNRKPLDREGWEIFMSAAEKMNLMLVKTEASLKKILIDMGLVIETVENC